MRLSRLLGAAALATATLAACNTPGNDTGNTGEGADDLTIVASFYPAAWLAGQVAGDHATVTTLTQPGVEAHDLELTGRQVAAVQEADLVVYLSGFQSAVDDAVEAADREATVDLAANVEPVESDDDDDHEHAHDHGDNHADHDHDHGGVDPHLWLDPRNLPAPAHAIAHALGEAAPDLADEFEANAEALVAELETLHGEFETGLATCDRRTFVVSHAAFGHLALAYDLDQVAIAGIDPSSEPSSAELARITDEIRATGVTTVFTERLGTSALAATVAREAGVETDVLDPIEGLTDETAEEDYLSLMRQNLEALRGANGCTG